MSCSPPRRSLVVALLAAMSLSSCGGAHPDAADGDNRSGASTRPSSPTPTARERTAESSAATPVRISFGAVLHAPAQADADGAQYDHTTRIKTILLAFARNPATALARMPGRVQRAPDLADVLLEESRTDVDDPRNARDLMDTWRQQARRRRMALPAGQVAQDATASLAPDGAGHPLVLTDFQSDWRKFATTMRNLGVEP